MAVMSRAQNRAVAAGSIMMPTASSVPSAWKPLTRFTTTSARNAICAMPPARLTERRKPGEQKSDRGARQDGMRHGVADEAHAAQHQEHADRSRSQGERQRAGERAPHELELGEGGNEIIVHGECDHAATTQASACSSNASHMRRALVMLSGVSTVAVAPQATDSRAS